MNSPEHGPLANIDQAMLAMLTMAEIARTTEGAGLASLDLKWSQIEKRWEINALTDGDTEYARMDAVRAWAAAVGGDLHLGELVDKQYPTFRVRRRTLTGTGTLASVCIEVWSDIHLPLDAPAPAAA